MLFFLSTGKSFNSNLHPYLSQGEYSVCYNNSFNNYFTSFFFLLEANGAFLTALTCDIVKWIQKHVNLFFTARFSLNTESIHHKEIVNVVQG